MQAKSILPTIGTAALTGIGMGIGYKFLDWLTSSDKREAEMNHQRAREGEERGRGFPLDTPERIARHYNISVEEACALLEVYSPEELLPERGYGLTHSSPGVLTGTSMQELGTALNVMEDSLNSGEKARLQLATYELPPQEDLDVIWAEMIGAGFHVSKPTVRVVDGIPVTSMVLTKGSPVWAALIPLIVPIGIMGLVAFGLVKIETITKALFPIILATGGLVVLALGIMRKPAETAAEAAARKYLR